MNWQEFKIRFSWKIKKAAYSAVGLVLFFIFKMLKRTGVINWRIGFFHVNQIGHFLHVDLFLRQMARDDLSAGNFLFFSCKPANLQLYCMFKRRINIILNDFLFHAFLSAQSYFKNSDIWIESPYHRAYELINEVAPQVQFLKEEEDQGQKFQESLGIKQEESFICLSVRDHAYIKETRRNRQWAHHNYRDCRLDNYLMAAKYLTSLGHFVIRMGYMVVQQLPEMDHVIDYATKYRTDFADIYLSAKCKFFLASEAGLNSVAWVFNVPVAYANVAPPLAVAGFNKHDVFMPKKLWDTGKKRFVTFPEIIKFKMHEWYHNDDYLKAGMEIIENTPEEILGLVQEINGRLDGTWVESDEDRELQERYRRIIPQGHRCYGHPSRISSDFLRKNMYLLEESPTKNRALAV